MEMESGPDAEDDVRSAWCCSLDAAGTACDRRRLRAHTTSLSSSRKQGGQHDCKATPTHVRLLGTLGCWKWPRILAGSGVHERPRSAARQPHDISSAKARVAGHGVSCCAHGPLPPHVHGAVL